jgi:pyruvate kinase
VVQKHIIERCNYYGTPVITATQMLESMIENPRPTRAEASDVANAVIDGTDCVMLSGETSVGRYPLEAVRTMDRVVRKAEEHCRSEAGRERFAAALHDVPGNAQHKVTDAIGRACCVVAEQTGAAAIITLTSSGGTARLVAKYRPRTPILALTDSADTLRRLSFVWGVRARLIPSLGACTDLFGCLRRDVLASGVAREGDAVVYTAGMPFAARCSTNMLKVERL